MKPAAFGYHRPASVAEALTVLDELGEEAKVLAGGQSLVPLLCLRLATPAHLVDVNGLADLAYVRVTGDVGRPAVRVGALARHADVAADRAARAALPLLAEALADVAHPTIRNRGTSVGSLVHADPAGELTAVLAVLGGTVEVARRGGSRVVAAADFFLGPLESAVGPGELAVAATFPCPPAGTGSAWLEVARRHGDYALCGVAALVTLDDAGRVGAARAGYVSGGPTPVVLDLTDPVVGRPYDAADWAAAGRLARDHTTPGGDIHASAAYRRALVATLTTRALRRAAERAAVGLADPVRRPA
ncbi:MAG: FAD binding domain-containing protein [Actinomycetota bacterium]